MEQESIIEDGENLILSWISSLASFDHSENGVASIAVQTGMYKVFLRSDFLSIIDETLGMAACPQSTPDTTTNSNVRYLLPREKNFIADLDTPPDSLPGEYSAL